MESDNFRSYHCDEIIRNTVTSIIMMMIMIITIISSQTNSFLMYVQAARFLKRISSAHYSAVWLQDESEY